MTQRAVTDLMAARRNISNVLLHLSISGNDLTVQNFCELLDYFAEHPTEYLEFINQCPEQF